MRRFLVRLSLFILFAVLFYVPALFIYGNIIPPVIKSNLNYKIGSIGHLFTRMKEVKKIHDVDILFLGSSHAYRGFDPRVFASEGFSTFNLGSSAQTPIQTNVLINRYLDTTNPKLIIYEVYPETFIFDGVESSLDLIANDYNDMNSLAMALELNHFKTYNTLLFGFMQDYFHLSDSFKEPINKNDDSYVPGGYVLSKERHYSPGIIEKRKIEINESQLKSFSEVLANLKSQHRDVILVFAPISPSMYSSYLNNSYFDSLMTGYGEYYNFNKILSLNDSLHFNDSDHLNQIGVEIFNDKLIDMLNQR